MNSNSSTIYRSTFTPLPYSPSLPLAPLALLPSSRSSSHCRLQSPHSTASWPHPPTGTGRTTRESVLRISSRKSSGAWLTRRARSCRSHPRALPHSPTPHSLLLHRPGPSTRAPLNVEYASDLDSEIYGSGFRVKLSHASLQKSLSGKSLKEETEKDGKVLSKRAVDPLGVAFRLRTRRPMPC